MKISGYLQTVRPVHIASQTDGNATGIATEPVPNFVTGQINRIPIIPATVLRGALRRATTDIASQEMAENGVRVPIEVLNAMRHGSNSGRMVNEPLPPSFFSMQREHPLMGLYGGGPRQGSGGQLRVAPLYPLCDETASNSMVPPHPAVETTIPGYRLTAETNMYPGLDIMKSDDPVFGRIVEDKDAKIDEIIAADVARRLRKGGDGEGPESTLRSTNLISHKYMIPGVLLHLDLKIDDRANDQTKGLLIISLLRFLSTNEIGGMKRVGYGSDVFNLGGAAANVLLDGEPAFEWDGTDLSLAAGSEAERLAGAYHAWSDGGKAWTTESLWKATGFDGIDLGVAAVKKTPTKPKTVKPAKVAK